MSHRPATRISAFESRWLAEALRLREAATGALEDAEAVRAARAAAADVEQRILIRARRLGEREGLTQAIAAWRPRARLLLLALAIVALISGFGVALAVLGDGSRPVNVVWALGGLLGVHLFSLLLWLPGLWLGGRDAGGALGQFWLWLSTRFLPGRTPAQVAAALAALLGRAGLTRWWLGAVTHGLWLLALAGALAGLLVTLAARRYGFVWETTILPAEAFVRFIQGVGWLPGQFGFAVPDAAAIRAAGSLAAGGADARMAWSSWLIGCVVVYGIVPRLLLWALCLGLFVSGRRRLRLDLGLPGYAALAARLAPPSERIGVTDAAPAALRRAHIDAAHPVGGDAAVLLGLELRGDFDWPPALPDGVRDGGVVDSREQRRRALAQLAAVPPRRLLVACDARLSPDRGSLEFIAELTHYAGECRVWLLPAVAGENPARRGHWRDSLRDLGLDARDVIEDADAALAWLGEGR
ncbi:MAG: DUF2868 domain-containing protein [Gammaproteobacteria bacterium]